MITAVVPMAIPVSADKSSGSNGLEKADDNVHDNTGPVSDQDIKFP